MLFLKRVSDEFDAAYQRVIDEQLALGRSRGQAGEALNVALGHLGEQNPNLDGVFQHIDFNSTIGGKARLNDRQLRDLIRHFSKHRLRNEDFEFPTCWARPTST